MIRSGGGGGGAFLVGSIGVGNANACMYSSSSDDVGEDDKVDLDESKGFFLCFSSDNALNSDRERTPPGISTETDQY